MYPRFTAKSLALFLAKFAALYAVAFWLLWTPAVFGTVHRFFIGTASGVLRLTGGDTITHTIWLHDDRTIHVRAVTPQFRKDFDIPAHYGTNLAIFAALVLASPDLTWTMRLLGLSAGAALIGVVNTLMMLGTIWNFEARYAELQPLLPTGVVSLLGRLANQLSPTGGLYMLPIFLWGFVLLSPVLTRDGPVTSARAARNDPCPCGSGRKYKACHGRENGN